MIFKRKVLNGEISIEHMVKIPSGLKFCTILVIA